jgi:transketolase
MRRTFRDQLESEMRENDKITLLVGDVGYGLFDSTRKEFPDRVINAGASEQLMIGMAVGMAMEGIIPVAYSITPFVLYRPFEVIRNYVNEENIPVKLVGSGRNDDYGVCGFSHYACEDLKVMDIFSNIKVFRPETKEDVNVKDFLYDPSPAYINLSR